MNKKNVRISALFVLISACAFAQEKENVASKQELEEVVVSDSKFALAKEKSGKVITKITTEELNNRQGQSVAAILNTVAGVEINGNQTAAGKNLGYYIRGGKNHQVLILIDGIPVNDASGISIEYDLRLLPVEQVECIEIMKGAASTLYGTGAATGVINIKLKKADKKIISGNAYWNVGTNATANNQNITPADFNQGFSIQGNAKKVSYFAALNSTEIKGMSQVASPNSSIQYEEDPFSRLNYLAKLGFKATDNLSLDFFGNLDQLKNSYDGTYDNSGKNDTNLNKSITDQFRLGFSPKYNYEKGEFILNTSFNKLVRSYNEFNSYSNTVSFSEYESRSINADGFNKYEFSTSFFLVSGVQYQFQDMDTSTPYANVTKESNKFNMIDPYVTGVFTSDFGLNLNVGARWNIHSQYGNQLVYNVNPSFGFQSIPLKILGSYSTAFISPSLYQLYSNYGNKNLTPEKNSTIEAGFETQLIPKKIKWNVVGFYREQNNSVGFDAAYKYINIDGMNIAKGVETEFTGTFSNTIHWNANYTFTQADEGIFRLIPKHKMNAAIDFEINKRFFFNANYQYVDQRMDAFFDDTIYAKKEVRLGAYQLLNALVRYEIVKNRITAFAAITNILNVDFVENVGYSALGRNFKLGLTINL
jgi:vitamin B12 transporter